LLSEALRLIRKFHHQSQTEAAAKLGISKSYLSELESGRKVPTLQLIERYGALYELPVSSILFFSESIGRHATYEDARRFVADKIIGLLRLIDKDEPHHGQ
jgi:transcriptional regulator with XRE-family HTH domain